MKRQWYQARIRWAEMVEGRGIRNWEEGLYLFRSEDREAAFRRALEIGEGGQSGGEEETAAVPLVVVVIDDIGLHAFHRHGSDHLDVRVLRLKLGAVVVTDQACHLLEPVRLELHDGRGAVAVRL